MSEMSKCEGCQKYADCASGSGLTWPCGAYVPVAADRESELEHFRELTKMVPFERLKELAEADARGMALVSKIPIGTMVYQLNQGSTDEVRIIDGEEYTRKVPNWYITHHEYSWVDAIVDAEHPERENNPHCRYYFTLEDARTERDRINAGGDPSAINGGDSPKDGPPTDVNQRFPYVEGQEAEIFYEGEWVRGRIVAGYRFRDGIVTIETESGKRLSCGVARKDIYRPATKEGDTR